MTTNRGVDAGTRFMQFVVPEPNTGCWLWTGALERGGYGVFSVSYFRRYVRAHRFSYEQFRGPIPAGLWVCHRCDTRPCVNPDHLFLGTAKDNAQDMVSKGRHHELTVTHCPKGHEYTAVNTQRTVSPRNRKCRACLSVRNHAAYLRRQSRKQNPEGLTPETDLRFQRAAERAELSRGGYNDGGR